MSVELDFWKYQKGIYLDNKNVYRNACCDQERVEGLEDLPIEDILKETAAVFQDWDAIDRFNYEKKRDRVLFRSPQRRRWCGLTVIPWNRRI